MARMKEWKIKVHPNFPNFPGILDICLDNEVVAHYNHNTDCICFKRERKMIEAQQVIDICKGISKRRYLISKFLEKRGSCLVNIEVTHEIEAT